MKFVAGMVVGSAIFGVAFLTGMVVSGAIWMKTED